VSNSAIKFVCFLSREFSFALYNNKCGMQRLSESVREIFSAFNFIVYILCQNGISIGIYWDLHCNAYHFAKQPIRNSPKCRINDLGFIGSVV